MRRAMGLMAGPERPPKTLEMTGRRRRASMAMPWTVLMTVTASAPASATATATATRSGTLGGGLAKGDGEGDDVGDVGGELDDDGESRLAEHAAGDGGGQGRVLPELHAPHGHVRAADVQLQGADAGHPFQPRRQLSELVHRVARDVDHHWDAPGGPDR